MAVQTPIPLSMDAVFPSGAYVAGAVEPVSDFDAPSVPGGQKAQKLDKTTELPLWAVPVIDGDETARGAAKSVKVTIVAKVPPEALAGLPFRPVEFDGLTVTPYVSDSNGSRPRVGLQPAGHGDACAGQACRQGCGCLSREADPARCEFPGPAGRGRSTHPINPVRVQKGCYERARPGHVPAGQAPL